MERRIILAVLISMAILFIYNLCFYPSIKRPIPPQTGVEEGLRAKEPISTDPLPQVLTTPVIPNLLIPEEELLIETEPLTIQLTPQGEIASLRLNKFKEKGSDLKVDLVRRDSTVYPLEITLAKTRLIPSGFRSISEREKEFTFQILKPEGIEIKKRLRPDDSGRDYLMRVEIEASNSFQKDFVLENLSLGWRGGRANISADGELRESKHVYLSNKKMKEVTFKGVGIMERTATFLGLWPKREPQMEETKVEEEISWIAQRERYFLTMLIPQDKVKGVYFRKTKDSFLEMDLVIPPLLVPALGKKTISFKIYAGPNDYDELKALYPGAERLAGLNSLALLTLKTLRFFYKFTHNYGLAIILLTIIIKIILYPLTHASLKSMKNMQKLIPEMNRIKQRYKDNKEQLNREILALYRRHKVNPMSGCLPLLVQLPFLYAIFITLQTAIDLRGAPFVLWVRDLSDKDPYYVLPILMGITMFIQQKMSMKGQDPQQAKIMAFMPFIFTIMFLGFPSGLVLYWLVQNILSIGQQYLVDKSK